MLNYLLQRALHVIKDVHYVLDHYLLIVRNVQLIYQLIQTHNILKGFHIINVQLNVIQVNMKI